MVVRAPSTTDMYFRSFTENERTLQGQTEDVFSSNTIREAAGFFRSDEVRNIRMSRISFDDGYLTIRVEKSKTHQLRQEDEVVIALSSSSVCPVSPLKYYLSMLDINFEPINE